MEVRETLTVYVIIRRLGWEYGDDFDYRNLNEDAPLETYLDRNKGRGPENDGSNGSTCVPTGSTRSAGSMAASRSGAVCRSSSFLGGCGKRGLRVDEGDRSDLWQQYDELPDEQRQLVWDAVDQIRFYELIEMNVDLDG